MSKTTLLTISFVLLLICSWVLMFRQEQTLSVIGTFYPGTRDTLFQIRIALLKVGLNSVWTIILGSALTLGFIAYFALLKEKLELKKSIFLAILFQAIVFFSFPSFSTDIFDYILTNRLALVHEQNIRLVSPSVFQGDPFYPLASWQQQISPYGVINQTVYSVAGLLSNNDLIWTVFIHKLLAFALTLGTLFVVYKILTEFFPEKAGWGVSLIFWNPLFVLETAGSAHNIILTLFMMSLTLLFYLRKRYILAGILAAFSIHTKFIPIFLAIFLVLELLRLKKWSGLFQFTLPLVLLNVILFWIMGAEGINYLGNILIGKPIYWQSLPMIIHRFYGSENLIFLAIFSTLTLLQMFRAVFKNGNPLYLFSQTVLLYLLFFANFYLNWYILWPLLLVPFFPWGSLSKIILVFTVTSALAYPLYYLSLRFNYQNPLWIYIIYIFIAGIPGAYLLYGKIYKKS